MKLDDIGESWWIIVADRKFDVFDEEDPGNKVLSKRQGDYNDGRVNNGGFK